MCTNLYFGLVMLRDKVHAGFRRVFKDQAGAAELIATLVIVGIVLVLAFAFRKQLVTLVKTLWNKLIHEGNEGGGVSDYTTEWN